MISGRDLYISNVFVYSKFQLALDAINQKRYSNKTIHSLNFINCINPTECKAASNKNYTLLCLGICSNFLKYNVERAEDILLRKENDHAALMLMNLKQEIHQAKNW